MKGIIMSTESVRGIEEGTKTQFRQVIPTDTRPQSADTFMRGFPPNPVNVRMCGPYAKCDAPPGSHSVSYRVKPRYTPGETVYVKEAWGFKWEGAEEWLRDSAAGTVKTAYRAAGDTAYRDYWRTPLSMSESRARHFLRIESVRAERLQAISEEDARAEGIRLPVDTTGKRVLDIGPHSPLRYVAPGVTGEDAMREAWTFRLHYAAVWDSLNRKPGCTWADNPYLFRYEIRRIER